MRINQKTRAYIGQHSHPAGSSGKRYEEPRNYLIADVSGIPALVERTLTRLFGRPDTIDRGEVAYWVVPASVVAECAEVV